MVTNLPNKLPQVSFKHVSVITEILFYLWTEATNQIFQREYVRQKMLRLLIFYEAIVHYLRGHECVGFVFGQTLPDPGQVLDVQISAWWSTGPRFTRRSLCFDYCKFPSLTMTYDTIALWSFVKQAQIFQKDGLIDQTRSLNGCPKYGYLKELLLMITWYTEVSLYVNLLMLMGFFKLILLFHLIQY